MLATEPDRISQSCGKDLCQLLRVGRVDFGGSQSDSLSLVKKCKNSTLMIRFDSRRILSSGELLTP